MAKQGVVSFRSMHGVIVTSLLCVVCDVLLIARSDLEFDIFLGLVLGYELTGLDPLSHLLARACEFRIV